MPSYQKRKRGYPIMQRTNVSSGLDQDTAVGISRAVRVGDTVRVSALGPVDEKGNLIAEGDVARQTVACFEQVGGALNAVGASLGGIIQTRVYTTSLENSKKAAEIHGQIFKVVLPTGSFHIVPALPQEGWLVQVEVEAILDPKEAA